MKVNGVCVELHVYIDCIFIFIYTSSEIRVECALASKQLEAKQDDDVDDAGK